MIDSILSGFAGVLFYGVAYGMILYVITIGLSLTLGLMRFINLAHGAFAMFGGYTATEMTGRLHLPFALSMVTAALAMAAAGLVFERLFYRRLYGVSDLYQVLFTLALIFIAVAISSYVWGPLPQPTHLPEALRGRIDFGRLQFPIYRVMVIAVSAAIAISLWLTVERTRFGAEVRAAVDNRTMAEAVGIRTTRIFAITFALGSGLAGLGGALGQEFMPITPTYPIDYLITLLLVIAVGGLGSLRATFGAAMLLGIGDVACKYLLPDAGAFFLYVAVFVCLLWRPAGLFVRG